MAEETKTEEVIEKVADPAPEPEAATSEPAGLTPADLEKIAELVASKMKKVEDKAVEPVKVEPAPAPKEPEKVEPVADPAPEQPAIDKGQEETSEEVKENIQDNPDKAEDAMEKHDIFDAKEQAVVDGLKDKLLKISQLTDSKVAVPARSAGDNINSYGYNILAGVAPTIGEKAAEEFSAYKPDAMPTGKVNDILDGWIKNLEAKAEGEKPEPDNKFYKSTPIEQRSDGTQVSEIKNYDEVNKRRAEEADKRDAERAAREAKL